VKELTMIITNELNFGIGMSIGIIIGLLVSLILDKWHEWKDDMKESESK
jgi:hypothetical protein